VKQDLVYEIGVEEIPAGYLPPAARQLREEFERVLTGAGLSSASLETDATPRRLVLLARGIPPRQDDRSVETLGPPWNAAFDESGVPTKAAVGFAKGRGLDPGALRKIETERGPYAGATVLVKGRETKELLAESLPRITQQLAFPKTMKWGPARLRFARPIRWLLALFGDDVIPFELEGVRSGHVTWGHRILSPGPFEVRAAQDYEEALKRGRVILRAADRAQRIETLLQEAASRAGGVLIEDPELVQEVSYLVETPSVIDSTFDEEFLQLPAPVIITAMRDHQRYFALRDSSGRLSPRFLCVANSAPESAPQVREGNQRVLRARLDDARFYWNEDLKTTLEEKVPKLASVVWLEGFGSLLDKSSRLATLSSELAAAFAPAAADTARRAAFLSKADLVTEMIKDGKQFAALQGVMGREYALRNGEPEAVAQAIFEQHLPRFAGDDLPASDAGAVLALADRLDTLTGVWGAGQRPTGSKDPFALRRGALGILRIILNRRWNISTRQWTLRAAELFGELLPNGKTVVDEIALFIEDRLAGIFIEEGIAADAASAVLASSGDNPVDAWERARALERIRSARRSEFEALAAGLKRAKNILKKDSAAGEPSSALLAHEKEKALHAALVEVSRRVESSAQGRRYEEALAELAKLRAPIDAFFDSVMVLVDDESIRQNRLRLLGRIVDRIQSIADLSRLSLPE
jgi:glycyl-tRNA synthetase beta chain